MTCTNISKMNIEQFSTEELLKIVSELLDAMLYTNNQIPCAQVTYFHSRAVPNITVLAYLTRIHKFAPFSNEALLSILIYFDAIAKLENGFTINSYNIHRLLITSIVIAAKYSSDVFYANSRYAKVGGIPLRELNQLELEFLFLIDFQLYIKLEDLQDYANQLLSHAINSTSSIASIHITSKASSFRNIHPKSNNTDITLPLTPPYQQVNVRKYHPYQKPTRQKMKLGLLSPKDD